MGVGFFSGLSYIGLLAMLVGISGIFVYSVAVLVETVFFPIPGIPQRRWIRRIRSTLRLGL